MNIGFFIRHFTERGTEVSIYDYANYNEIILNNKSYIMELLHKSVINILLVNIFWYFNKNTT